jgi:hypothetical protein
MIRRAWQLGVAIGGIVIACGPLGRAAPAPGAVYVSVARSGRPVTGLTAKDFAVLVGGHEQPVISATPASEPLALVIFVEIGTQNDVSLTRTAVRSILGLVREQNPQARVAIVNSAVGPTFYEAAAQAGLLERTIGTLYSNPDIGNVVERLPELGAALSKEPSRRRVILAITPPGLTHGIQFTPQTAPDLAKSGCELWGIQVAQQGGNVLDRDDAYAMLITESGGQRMTAYGVQMLDSQARDMASLFLSQYLLTFQRPDARGTLVLRVGVRGQTGGTQIFAPGWMVTTP